MTFIDCQKPDPKGGPVALRASNREKSSIGQLALPDGRASDTKRGGP